MKHQTSPTNPDPGAAGPSRKEELGVPHEGSWARNSKLAYACLALFAVFLCAQSLTGWHVYDADQRQHGEPVVSFGRYLTTGHFVEATFENWESEFLQMGAFILLTAFLIQRGSAQLEAMIPMLSAELNSRGRGAGERRDGAR